MSDLKSKLPDLKEIGHMTGKLFKDIRTSVSEIIADYKLKHPTPEASKTEVSGEKTAVKKEEGSKEKATTSSENTTDNK